MPVRALQKQLYKILNLIITYFTLEKNDCLYT